MQKKQVIFNTLSLLLATLFINSPVNAGDIEWSGLYRIEGYRLENSEMRGGDGKKKIGYGLSHLVLRPKITASDGLTIYGQFDVFNNSGEANSQMGQVFGNGVRSATTARDATTSAAESNALSRTQKAEMIEVSQLYLTYNQEYGQLIVGRAPLQFGLGMTYSAGRGLFDHWYDTRDMVGYKIVMGNIYVLPMFGRPSGGRLNHSDNIDDYMVQVQYENPESDMELGLFYSWRVAGDQGSDAPRGTSTGNTNGSVLGGKNSTINGGINTKTVSVYALRDNERFHLGMEASFMSGEAGVRTSGGDAVTWSGFGIATELEYRPENSHWKYGLRAGMATGDDPESDAKFEGFSFNRNYDVAMLMFNHPLGQADFFRTGLVTGGVYDTAADSAGSKNINRADVETISNVMYFAPVAHYAFNDRWSMDNSLITGWLSTNPIYQQSVAKDLGYEWDLSVIYSPKKGVVWITQMGMLFPGSAWKGATDASGNYLNESAFTYGFGTKAAISF